MAYNENHLTKLSALKALAQKAQETYAQKTEVAELSEKIENLVTAGGEPNTIETIKVNGTTVTPSNKTVALTFATGTTNGTFTANGKSVAIKGLSALAYKDKVAKTDLADALSSEITNATTNITSANNKLTTLVGADVNKSVRAISAEEAAAEIAKIVAGADTSFDTLKEIADWITSHGSDAAAMNTAINENKTSITNLASLVGELPETATSESVVGYIAEVLTNYYTKAQVETKVNQCVKVQAIATDDEVAEMLNEVYGTTA